ncbi:Putative Carbonic anhydrase [Rhizopus microsporus]|nr:Putative Carbonic anhydrase [Rhizopus microsporus]
MRTCKAVQEYKRHQDYISDMSFCDAKSTLLAAGGDGILSIYDIRQPLTKIKVSQEIDDELLSLTTIKDGQTVIAGSQSGALYIWNNADWSSPPTKWIGHPNSVDALCALDQDTICSGSSDGLLRLITVSPNYKFEGILGDHEDEFPIERIVLTHDRAYMASCGHDLSLRFWNVEFLFESQKKRKRTEEPESVKLSYHTTGNKFDANDTELEGLFENNRQWAKAVQEQDPNFFKTLAEKQEPKILWIGMGPKIVQLGPGEIFIHKNIANVVCHSDLNCLSVLQYAVEVLKVEHVVVCGHSNCGGVAAALGQQQFGLIDNWLRNVKDVYRLNQNEMDKIDNGKERLLKLVEYNAINSAQNIVHSTIVQNAWKRGQKLTVHAWVYNLEKG